MRKHYRYPPFWEDKDKLKRSIKSFQQLTIAIQGGKSEVGYRRKLRQIGQLVVL